MASVEEYQARVVALAHRLPVEVLSLRDAAGRVLAEDLPALVQVPPFTNSAMDGYAVRAADVAEAPVRLAVIGDVPAGAGVLPTVGEGQAARIMTGAPLPPGADAVVPVEQTDQSAGAAPLPSVVEILEGVVAGRHVRRAGESTEVGAVSLRAGLRLGPAALAAAASVGYGSVPVRRRPRVAVLATGSELVPPGEPLGVGQIPDSNSLLLAGLVESFGGEVASVGVAGDEPTAFRAQLAEVASGADVVVTSGGVSAGAFEPVRQAGADLDFVKVSMQPGKPQAAGLVARPDGSQAVLLGLPGNPVSVFVSAWAFLRPLLGAFQGAESRWLRLSATAGVGWSSPAGRRQFVPVALDDSGVAVPAHALGSGSHLISALHLADALVVVPEGVTRVEAGDKVEAFLVS